MRLLSLFFLIGLFSIWQKPDTWKVIATYPSPSHIHNSVRVTKGDSAINVVFDYCLTCKPLPSFPKVGDKVTLVNNRKTMQYGTTFYDITNIMK